MQTYARIVGRDLERGGSFGKAASFEVDEGENVALPVGQVSHEVCATGAGVGRWTRIDDAWRGLLQPRARKELGASVPSAVGVGDGVPRDAEQPCPHARWVIELIEALDRSEEDLLDHVVCVRRRNPTLDETSDLLLVTTQR